ncbi:TetR/AcrR family transcriptional regulator [Phyllobacterium sophorae]|jgi:AcrR family transcriptional regulator|uniref:TetR family transcriptional regulator n=1 Tax=Phyllobacterium sophorae TaxID=1520277 RepID=A0A2P7BDE0_9HYPH|nr:TetR/AcrR family transcriptional regulator [Phyllobacterium sophorae]PSH64452.1 TetR family transcriptional regulator [Phyllobacterium sophorae]
MATVSAKKMPKAQRRNQLLSTALYIIREQGTDALTLGYLAERAGVSKPIAYEHFGTRAGLLIALYEQLDQRQVDELVAAIEETPKQLDDIARVMSDAYMACYRSIGPEWSAISAALKGDEAMERFQASLIDGYVDLYCKTLSPYAALPAIELRLRCVGIVGAAEAISKEMMRGNLDEASAARVLQSLIVKWLSI